MPYDADPAATSNPTTGQPAPATLGDIWNANFAEIGAPWTSFTPTWTGSGGNPAIGNGTIAGAYKQLGKLLFVRYRIAMGSTTTYGAGNWKLRLPNSLSAVAGTTQVVSAWALDFGTAYFTGIAVVGLLSGIDDYDDFVIVSHNSGNTWTATVPHTWATSDVLVVEGCIEVA